MCDDDNDDDDAQLHEPVFITAVLLQGVSLIKGLDFDARGPVLLSETIRSALGIEVSAVAVAGCLGNAGEACHMPRRQVGVLCGANVANEVASEEFCEVRACGGGLGTPHRRQTRSID